MATSGRINGTTKNKSGTDVSSKYGTWINWQRNSYSIENNTSNITVTVYVQRIDSWNGDMAYDLTQKPSLTLTVGGSAKSPTINYIDTRDHKLCTVATWTGNVSHNNDGTLNLSISCSYSTQLDYLRSGSISGTATLDTIPRKATVTSATDFTDESNPTIHFTNNGNFPVEPFIFVYPWRTDLGRYTYEIYRSKGTYTSPYTFSLTEAERTALRSACNTSTEYVVWMGVKTYNGNTYMDNSQVQKKLTIVNSNPSTTMTLSPIGCPSWAYVSSKPIYIQGVTKVGATFANTLKKGATLQSNTLKVDNFYDTTSPYESLTLSKSGKIDVVGSVTDSRGITFTAPTQKIDVVPYANPYVAHHSQYDRIICGRCDENGNLANSGTNLKVVLSKKWSPLTNNTNKATLQYLVETTGYSSGWKTLSANTEGTNGSFDIDTIVSGVTLDVDKAYTITFKCIDTFGNSTPLPQKIPTEDVVFHLKEGGNGAAFGKYSEKEKTLDIAWDVNIGGDLKFGDKDLLNYTGTKFGWGKNTVVYNSLTVANAYNKTITGASVNLEANSTYLVLAGVMASTSDQTAYTDVLLANVESGGEILIISAGRGGISSGGGVTGFAIVKTTSATYARCQSYGYKNASFNLYTRIVAIKLDS